MRVKQNTDFSQAIPTHIIFAERHPKALNLEMRDLQTLS
jgi:hypothetical protein